jgi:hypothetical protein
MCVFFFFFEFYLNQCFCPLGVLWAVCPAKKECMYCRSIAYMIVPLTKIGTRIYFEKDGHS